jgi:hypothetical protein
MADVKYRAQEQLSAWMEYRLLTDKLDPPVFRCRLRHIDNFVMSDVVGIKGIGKPGQAAVDVAVEVVADWDLTQNGVPIPLTPENKFGWLYPLLNLRVEGGEEAELLGIRLVTDAANQELFLKN